MSVPALSASKPGKVLYVSITLLMVSMIGTLLRWRVVYNLIGTGSSY